MSDKVGKFIVIFVFAALSSLEMHSQECSAGTSWSISGISADFKWKTAEDSFMWAQAKMELTETFLNNSSATGASASLTWNSTFGEKKICDDSIFQFYAGPGISAGYCKDYKSGKGAFIGLMGRAGVMIMYDRNIDICVGLSPVLGIHITSEKNSISTQYYKHGLIQCIIPEISICYRF